MRQDNRRQDKILQYKIKETEQRSVRELRVLALVRETMNTRDTENKYRQVWELGYYMGVEKAGLVACWPGNAGLGCEGSEDTAL
jgi:hypothetical protein